MRWPPMARVALCTALACCTASCFVDRSGLAPSESDGGPRVDGGATRDATMDDGGRPPDDAGTTDPDASADAGAPIPADWFDPAWKERRRLTFDNAPHAEDLDDFPVLIVLEGDRVDYARAGPGGEQLRFVDPDGTELAFEIERWQAGGTSHVWVRVPRVDAASDADFVWMYADHPGASDGQDPAAVWSDDHRGVWHFDGDFADSSPNANHGSSSPADDTEGAVGGAKRFDRDEASLVPDDPSLDITSGVTISAWLRPTSLSHHLGVLSKREGCESEANYALFIRSDDQIQFEHHDAGWRTFHQGALVVDRWQWVAATFDPDANEVILYLNGAAVGAPMTNARSLITDANHIELGVNGGCGGDYMEGPMDEVRLEAVARSGAWIAAQHRSMTDDYVTYGPPERIP